jgi:hypothetical protein
MFGLLFIVSSRQQCIYVSMWGGVLYTPILLRLQNGKCVITIIHNDKKLIIERQVTHRHMYSSDFAVQGGIFLFVFLIRNMIV